jgi:hypothetical protein
MALRHPKYPFNRQAKSLPTRFGHAGQSPLKGFFAETDTAELETANVAARASAEFAAVAHTVRVFAMQLAINHRFLCH